MKLKDLENLFAPCYVLLGFIFLCLVIIGLILFFDYYDKSLRIRQKNEDEHIKEIVDKKLSERKKD